MQSDSIEHPNGILTLRTLAMPAHTNPNNDIFGGWLVSQMDIGGGIAAKGQAKSRVVTVAIDKLIFIKPVAVGDIVSVYVNLIKTGRTSLQFLIDVWTANRSQDSETKVAQGIFTFVAIDDNGRPHPVIR
jgi:acyl-CoA thioesterase YciA